MKTEDQAADHFNADELNRFGGAHNLARDAELSGVDDLEKFRGDAEIHHHSLENYPEGDDFGPIAAVHAAHAAHSKGTKEEATYPINRVALASRGLAEIEKFALEPAAA